MREIISNPNMRAIADAQANILFDEEEKRIAYRRGFYAALQTVHSLLQNAEVEDADNGGWTDGDIVDMIHCITE